MILKEATFEAYGYYPRDLTYGSRKRVLVACVNCGKIRETSKHDYHPLCNSCAMKGNTNSLGYKHTNEQNANLSAAKKGNTNTLGLKHTEEAKALMSVAAKGNTYALGSTRTDEIKAKMSAAKKGQNPPNWKGGKKLRVARGHAKRRELGHTPLMPLKEGEDGHHVTNEYIIGVPAKVHRHLNGGGRKKHRTQVLQWLKGNDKKKYKRVLCVLAKEPIYMIQKREIL